MHDTSEPLLGAVPTCNMALLYIACDVSAIGGMSVAPKSLVQSQPDIAMGVYLIRQRRHTYLVGSPDIRLEPQLSFYFEVSWIVELASGFFFEKCGPN